MKNELEDLLNSIEENLEVVLELEPELDKESEEDDVFTIPNPDEDQLFEIVDAKTFESKVVDWFKLKDEDA
jgi:hypothetical protein